MRVLPGSSARTVTTALLIGVMAISAIAAAGCSSAKVKATKPIIAEGEHDPEVWGERYPEVYEQWLATRDKRPANKSPYKRGYDGGRMYDKLSEYPFMALLFKGWGFGIDYKEPRGHYYMLIDQSEADPSRVKAGGACITCKSPYAEDLQAEDKSKLFGATYGEAVAMIPKEHRELGATCIDCHDNATLGLSTRRWTADAALKEIGLGADELTSVQQRDMVCGQCHCTYSVMKQDGKSVDVDFPWEGGEWGAITVEDIIGNLEGQKERLEWTQEVTGMKLGFIRHPDVEFFTAGSVHANAGVTCADCHMPPKGAEGVADHNIMSPLKSDMVACKQCHKASAEEMRAKVIAIQKKSLVDFTDAGYRVATVAKLFELANRSLESTVGDTAYDEAASHYRQAFYRVGYMGAENSVGFHNPGESSRILKDAVAEATTAEIGLRKLLAAKGVKVPKDVPLDLPKYLTDRGVHKLDFVRSDYIADPSGRSERRASVRALLQ